MAHMRPVKLDDWGISWEEYKELSYFCLQYEQKKRDAAALLTIKISTPIPVTYKKRGREYGEFLPHGSGQVSDPVAATAARREKLLDDVRLIERAAKLAGGEMASYLLQAVTRREGLRKVLADTRAPIGERQFYEMRRQFFWLLRELRNGGLAS